MTQKNEICGHFLGKNNFFEIFASTLTRFFFSKFKIFKIFFIQPPKFIPYTNFKHQKWKLQGGFIIVPLPYWTGRASKQAAFWFLPHLACLGLRELCKGKNHRWPWECLESKNHVQRFVNTLNFGANRYSTFQKIILFKK